MTNVVLVVLCGGMINSLNSQGSQGRTRCSKKVKQQNHLGDFDDETIPRSYALLRGSRHQLKNIFKIHQGNCSVSRLCPLGGLLLLLASSRHC